MRKSQQTQTEFELIGLSYFHKKKRVPVLKSFHRSLFSSLMLLLVCLSAAFAQGGDCTFSPTPLPLIRGKADFEDLKQRTWQALQCAPESSETYITALSSLADVYRMYRKADSLEYYQTQSLSLSNKYLAASHPTAFQCQLRVGITAINNGDFTTGKAILNELDSLLPHTRDEHQLLAIELIRLKANYHRDQEQLEEALALYEEGLQLCETLNNKIGQERQSTFYGSMAAAVESNGDPLRALELNQKSLDLFFEHHDDTHPEAVAVYSNLGMDYWRTGMYQKAIGYLNNSYQSLEMEGRSDEVPTDIILNNMGAVYYQLGDLDKAIDCYQKSAAIRTDSYGPEHLRTMVSTFMLGSMYAERNQPEKTVEVLESARQILEKGSNGYYTAVCNNNLAIAYRTLGDFERARECYAKALDIYLDQYSGRLVTIANTQYNLGFLFTQMEDYDQAKYYLQQALDNLSNALDADNGEVLNIQAAYAEAEYRSGAYENARERYTTILSQWNLPADGQYLEELEDRASALKVLQSAVDFHWSAYEKTSSEEELHQLIRLAENGLELLQIQRTSAKAESSKVFLTHNYYGLYEKIIQTQLILADTKEQEAQAFAYNASAKAGVLYDAIQLSGASSFSGIPADSLQRLRDLNAQLSFIEKQIAEYSSDSTKLTSLQKQAFNIKRSVENTEQGLAQYPAYAEITETTQQLSASEVSEMLPAGSAMINYFLGDQSLTVFVTPAGGETSAFSKELPGDFEEQLAAFLEITQQRPQTGSGSVAQYQEQAEALFLLLLGDALQQITAATDHLIIVPDGILAYLPFGVLVTPSVEQHSKFADLPYLIKDFEISYAPSPIIWQSMTTAKVPTKGALVFAPSFSEVDASATLALRKMALGPLFFNTEEAQNIQDLTGSTIFTQADATIDMLNQYLPDADILHFATHAKVEENLPRYSYLAFSGTNSIPEQLFLSEIYNLDLKANMVVLSACETGLGKLQRGEGLISLARGFAYAGAKSIVPSLWAVNDQATASIMTTFYQGLADGDRKSFALQQAQLQYLDRQNEDHLAHPYYWGAFTIIGDNAPVSFASNHILKWLAAGGVTLLLLVFFLRRNKK